MADWITYGRDRAGAFATDIDEHKAAIDQFLSDAGVSEIDGFPNTQNARVIGAFIGVAPGLTWGGVELQTFIAYDQETGGTGYFNYAGGAIGPSVGPPILRH